MTKEEAIKYLQQLYPNGGHCWLDEQRIEAIGMAVKALQEELVSEDLEKAAEVDFIGRCENHIFGMEFHKLDMISAFKAGAKWQEKKDESYSNDLGDYINELSKQFPEVSFAKLSRIAVRVAKWQKGKIMKEAKSGVGNNGYYIQFDDGTWIDLDPSMNLKPAFNVEEDEKVTIAIIKED